MRLSITGLTGVGEGIIEMVLTLLAGVVIDRLGWFPIFAGAAVMPLGSLAALFFYVRRCNPVNPEEIMQRA